jgi:hypothetical protein
MTIHDVAPEDFKSALKKKWSGAVSAMDYYDWVKSKEQKKAKVVDQPQVKESIWSFKGMMDLMDGSK